MIEPFLRAEESAHRIVGLHGVFAGRQDEHYAVDNNGRLGSEHVSRLPGWNEFRPAVLFLQLEGNDSAVRR